jgi:hypothetical protein
MGSDSDWLEQYVSIDPLLKEPLDLYGRRAKRRHLAEALLRQLDFEHRMDRFSDTTYRLAFDMLPRLIDALDHKRVHLPSRARQVAGGDRDLDMSGLYIIHLVEAVVELGWSHVYVPGGETRQVLRSTAEVYISEMTSRVLRMLRHWERRGFLHDAAA